MHAFTATNDSRLCPNIDSIKQLLCNQRSNLLSYLLKLNKSIDANHQDLMQALNQRFCEVLVDYISISQFRLCDECQLENHELMALQNSAAQAVAFNDAYGALTEPPRLGLKRALEHLALVLETRFEVEDDICHDHLPVLNPRRATETLTP